MLNGIQKYRVPLLVAALFATEAIFSSFATCLPMHHSAAAQYDYPEHCSAFNGPLWAIVVFGLLKTDIFLKAYEHELVAGFTVVLAVSTIGLWLSTRHLWGVTKTAVDLANKEFISTHRPRVRLKHAWFTDQTAWRLNGPLEINLDLVNVGNTSAHIVWINYQSLVVPAGQRLPQRPPYDEPLPVGATPITRFKTTADLPSGITLARPVCDGILDQQEIHDILWGTQQLYLIGTIEYWDYAGLRQTAFCRRFTYQSYPPAAGDMGRFEKENDSDYEYDD